MSRNAASSIGKDIDKLKYNNIILPDMVFGKKTPREESEDITSGKEKPHFIGPKSKEALLQEIWSLDNTKPEFRKGYDYTKRKILVQELKAKYGVDYTIQEWTKVFKPK